MKVSAWASAVVMSGSRVVTATSTDRPVALPATASRTLAVPLTSSVSPFTAGMTLRVTPSGLVSPALTGSLFTSGISPFRKYHMAPSER